MHEKQENLDAIGYPPTHTYLLDSMEPTGILKHRVKIMKHIIDEHCSGNQNALEIGYNKGFLLYFLSQQFQKVDGCEPRNDCYEFVQSIRKEKLKNIGVLKNTSFRDFPWISLRRYDCIVLANCLHYIYREYGDFSFLHKIAYLSNGIVIIEGFIDISVDDVASKYAREHWEPSLVCGFNEQSFKKECLEHFWIETILPSPTSPARNFIVLKSKQIPIVLKSEAEKKEPTSLFSHNKNIHRDHENIYKWYRDDVDCYENWYKQFFFSRMSPYLEPIKFLIIDDKNKIRGYGMKYIKDEHPKINYLISQLSNIEKDLYNKRITLIDVHVINFIGLKFIDYDFESIQLTEDFVENNVLISRYSNRRVRLFSDYISTLMDWSLDVDTIKLW